MNDALLTPPVALGVAFAVALVIDAAGARLAGRGGSSEGVRSAYASGEDMSGRRIRPDYDLYNVAIGFTILHMAVLLVAVPSGPIGLKVLLLGVVLVAAVSLFRSLRSASSVHHGG